MNVRIAPSILAADFANLGREIAAAERGGADLIHVDVMDGHFVPNITIGPPVVRAIKRVATVPLDVHLMIEEPDRYIDAFVDAGAAMLSVHVEVLPHLHRTIHVHQDARRQSRRRAQPVDARSCRIENVAGDVDYVLVMSVNPGFGGQTFIPRSVDKIRAVRAPARSRPAIGARSRSTAASISTTVRPSSRAGADMLVAGQAVFGGGQAEQATRALKAAAIGAARASRAARLMTRRRTVRRRSSACATPRPTRWASSITPTTSCGSRSAAPTGCVKPAGPIARWKTKGWRCR